MEIIKQITEMQKWSQSMRQQGKTIGVVPTMGYLHEGHLSLIDVSRQHADVVIVTIFVNPTQFAPNEDLASYPRDFERDRKLCEERNVEVIFAPEPEEMYSADAVTWVIEEKLSQGLCGEARPTHFRGVTTVVTKLFHSTLPDFAVFGQKDAQQAAIIKRMVRDLNFPVKIITAPIVREPDGLAMSSRNRYLNDEERQQALSIFRSFQEAKDLVNSGQTDTAFLISQIEEKITSAGGEVDYVKIVDSEDLESINNIDREVLIAVAAKFGTTRLIDNVRVKPA